MEKKICEKCGEPMLTVKLNERTVVKNGKAERKITVCYRCKKCGTSIGPININEKGEIFNE